MPETTYRCEDRCIETGNLEKALYYKWLRVDLWQRNVTLIESAQIR